MDCQIRVKCRTKTLIKEQSLTHDADGKATESYDEVIRRGMAALAVQSQPSARIDVSKL